MAGQPNTTRPPPGHKIYPYLLRNMTIDRPYQVWAADITYLPIGRASLKGLGRGYKKYLTP